MRNYSTILLSINNTAINTGISFYRMVVIILLYDLRDANNIFKISYVPADAKQSISYSTLYAVVRWMAATNYIHKLDKGSNGRYEFTTEGMEIANKINNSISENSVLMNKYMPK